MTTFKPDDKVVLKLWPELGTGQVLSVSNAETESARVAKVNWPDANQTSTHSVVALKPAVVA